MTNLKTSLAVATVAAAAFALPGTALADDYRKCKDTEATVAGGLIGGSVGTIIGEEVAGRGNRTEGAIAGAVIGGVIGAAIGDGASDCEKDGRIYRNGRVISTYNQPVGYTTVRHPRGYQYNHRDYGRDYRRDNRHRGYDRGRGYDYYNAQQHDRDLRRIDRRMDRLRAERRQLKDRRRYERGRWVDRRLSEIAFELDQLKDQRQRLKRQWDRARRNNGHRNPYRRAY
jgi:uncharacterized protein YcfJ